MYIHTLNVFVRERKIVVVAKITISDLDEFEYDGSPEILVESIRYVHNFDIFTLYDHAFSRQDNAGKLSLVIQRQVPGKFGVDVLVLLQE